MYLKTQLYESISLRDKEKEAKIYETLRCVSKFNDNECIRLLDSLKEDYLKRIVYIAYLTKSKKNLIDSLSSIENCLQRVDWHTNLLVTQLISTIARTFFETKQNETQINNFVNQFRELPSLDEKFEFYKSFVTSLKSEFSTHWTETNSPKETIDLANKCLERMLISKVYRNAMFPNGEIDHFRDTKVSECFSELAKSITPSHPLIGISKVYENECPWLPAQLELRRLNVYKTPEDKLDCIKKCLLIIQNMLAIAKSPVCADDLHPVLIFVIIKANPPTFLSNVQYIEGYFGSQLESEDYYWAQFKFAFSYIKANMLNK